MVFTRWLQEPHCAPFPLSNQPVRLPSTHLFSSRLNNLNSSPQRCLHAACHAFVLERWKVPQWYQLRSTSGNLFPRSVGICKYTGLQPAGWNSFWAKAEVYSNLRSRMVRPAGLEPTTMPHSLQAFSSFWCSLWILASITPHLHAQMQQVPAIWLAERLIFVLSNWTF